ncbi:MAG: ABC transporter permease [Pseudomonadota bacterium]
MSATEPALRVDERGCLVPTGAWTSANAKRLEGLAADIAPEALAAIDLSHLDALDTNGAYLLHSVTTRADRGIDVIAGDDRFRSLFELVDRPSDGAQTKPRGPNPFESIGRYCHEQLSQLLGLFSFLGEVTIVQCLTLVRPRDWRPRAMLSVVQQAGVNALPIVGLLAFLMGVVIGYQGGVQLKTYGANIFVVELLTLSILREIAPLVTAIIVAGRSGSAYAAELATMEVNEEVDALKVMGMNPIALLVLPKVIGLIIALPLLTVFADIAGVMGGIAIATLMLDVGFDEFTTRIPEVIPVSAFIVGIIKVPVFAAIIAIVGCYQGLSAQGGAEGVGRQTTTSVVQAIFLVIVADAVFSVIYSVLGV